MVLLRLGQVIPFQLLGPFAAFLASPRQFRGGHALVRVEGAGDGDGDGGAGDECLCAFRGGGGAGEGRGGGQDGVSVDAVENAFYYAEGDEAADVDVGEGGGAGEAEVAEGEGLAEGGVEVEDLHAGGDVGV